MKKIITFIAFLCFVFSCAFCNPSTKGDKNTERKIKVVTTIFPEYDWVRNIAGDSVDLTLLVNKGTDMHSWQPSSADMIKVSTADVFIYVGGESDGWVSGALSNSVNKKQVSINLMEILKDCVREEEIVEGMQSEEDEGETDEVEYDEHVWLSLVNAGKICSAVTDVLCSVLPDKESMFRKNCADYVQKLSELDREFSMSLKNSKRKEILVGDRFPFRYLAEDYNLKYYAAFAGCSAETEASFKTITFLVSKLNETEIPVILVLENSDQKIARTLVKNTRTKNQQILILDSIQSVGSRQILEGATYLGIMKKNLDVLKIALN